MNDVTPGLPDQGGAPAPDPAADPAADESGRSGEPGGEAGPAAYEPAAPVPLGVVREPTGDAAVDAVLDRLADADHLTADGHLDVYEDVHEGLRTVLGALDAPDRTAHHPPHPVPHDHRS
ncbi:hypothetical protein [Streptomyces tsukubensis]|uniref:hypothetical protein n=1 Tax=Streptomyces tsukubensis TaxID=83656 RepID=UPI00344E0FC2